MKLWAAGAALALWASGVAAHAAPPLPSPLLAALGAEREPDAAAIEAYFAQGARTLDLFCKPADDCAPRRDKKALFKLFFRGSFAQIEPDAEHEDPRAAYARQAAAYFTQETYACSRPLSARVLETLWQLAPRADDCADTVPFIVDADDGRLQLRSVDPDRVAAIHFLFAGPSGKSFSRYGHAGLRLVICDDARPATGAVCDEDLDAHLALGFRAAVDELDLSMWKGMTGGYALRLYAEPFMRNYSTYTIDEFRSLSSLPLQLDAEQRALLVRALAEVHWSYQNEYRFFTRNCASELSWLLRVVSAVSDASPPWLAGGNVRPDRLFARAQRSPAFEAGVLDDLQQAEREGFYFPDSTVYYEQALDVLAQRLRAHDLSLPARDFPALRELDAEVRRNEIYAPALMAPATDAEAPSSTYIAHAALVLEAWIERRQRRVLLAALARYYAEMTDLLLAQSAYFEADEQAMLARCMSGFSSSDGLGRSTSGVPGEAMLPASGCAFDSDEFRTALAKLLEVAPPIASQQRQLDELNATVGNVNWLALQFDPAMAGPATDAAAQHSVEMIP